MSWEQQLAVDAGDSCSYTTAFQAKHGGPDMSEALWNKTKTQGDLGVLIGKAKKGEIADGADIYLSPGSGFKIGWNAKYQSFVLKGKTGTVLDILNESQLTDKITHQGFRRIGKPPPTISPLSNSLGHLSDEDVSVLFVKTKDEIALAKSIPIKGANPALDTEVYEAIGKIAGYSKEEVIAKITAYKNSGAKLSSLKKKVLANDQLYAKAVAKAKAGKIAPPLPSAASPTVQAKIKVEAVQQLAKENYSQEDLVKAYIKAKESVAADAGNKFTLYSKGPDFDKALEKAIQDLGMNVKIGEVDSAVADYVASGKKVSSLKKKMLGNGEMQSKAPTLKKKLTEAEKKQAAADATANMPATNSVTVQKHQIDEAIKVSDFVMDELVNDDIVAQKIFDALGTKIANYKSINQNAEYFFEEAKKLNLSLSKVVKLYDEKKAAALGLPNSNFYEKKLLDHFSTAEGKKQAGLLLHPPAKPAYQPTPSYSGYTPPTPTPRVFSTPLPADSVKFETITVDEASKMQSGLAPWTGVQKAGLRKYTGSSYSEINGALRGIDIYGGSSAPDIGAQRNVIEAMDKGMRPLPKDLILHRGTSARQFGITSSNYSMTQAEIDELKAMVGKTVTDHGYLSTSVGGRAAFSRDLIMEIETPKGSLGAYVNDISSHPGENELILARHTEMQILSVDQEGSKTIVRMRIVNQDQNANTRLNAVRPSRSRKPVSTPLTKQDIHDLEEMGVHPSQYPASHEEFEELSNY